MPYGRRPRCRRQPLNCIEEQAVGAVRQFVYVETSRIEYFVDTTLPLRILEFATATSVLVQAVF